MNLRTRHYVILVISLMVIKVNAQVEATVNLIESLGGCNLETDCDEDIICVDIQMTIDEDTNLDSYNIWVTYDGNVLSRQQLAPNDNSGDGDNSCVIDNGNQDTDLESLTPSAWRVAGVPGSQYSMVADQVETIHTICFLILDEDALDGTEICTGGDQANGALRSTATFDNNMSGGQVTDDEIPQSCFVVNTDFVSCSLLPVEYLFFNVEKESASAVLNWATASELNNDYFDIEHSVGDGRWNKIGVEPAAENSIAVNNYSFIHKTPVAGINYYRLVQYDFDGAFEISEVKSVSFDVIETFEFSIYPNPASTHLTIRTNYSLENHRLVVRNMRSEVMLNPLYENSNVLEIESLLPGVYSIDVVDNNTGAVVSRDRFVVAD